MCYVAYMEGSTLFVTTASTETLNSTILGVACFEFLPSLSQKLHPKSYRLAKQTSLYNFITRTNQKLQFQY